MLAKLPKNFNYDNVAPKTAWKTNFSDALCNLQVAWDLAGRFLLWQIVSKENAAALNIHLICFLNYTEFKRILSHDILSTDKTFNGMQIINRNYFFVFYAQIVQVSHVCHFVIHIKG